jgi:hypothetical protein
MSDEWGPWVEHDGKGCPVEDGIRMLIRWEDCFRVFEEEVWSQELLAEAWDWSCFLHVDLSGHVIGRILAYRTRKPRALQQLIDLVENLPVPEPERVDA